jgi:sugar phosphate isomerase/epimerase
MHVHDNHGMKDEHLWPGDGTIDWKNTAKQVNALKSAPAAVLEIGYTLGDAPGTIPDRIRAAFDKLA